MNRICGLLTVLFGLASMEVYASSTTSSCSSTVQPGYALTKIQEKSSSCSGKNRYTFTKLAGETKLDTCTSVIPSGWVNSALKSYSGPGACGTSSTSPKQVWQISNTYDKTALNSCLSHSLPTGWVVTRQRSYSGSGDCGPATSSKRFIYEVQSSAGQSQMSVCSMSKLPTGWSIGATSSSSNCGSTSGNLWKILNLAVPDEAILHRYGNTKTGDKLYTTKRDDSAQAKQGYSYEAVAAKTPDKAVFGTTALHRYFNKSSSDSLYTITRDDALQTKAGYAYAGVAANVYTAKVPKATPLYRYWNATNKHHLYLIEHYPSGVYGYKLQGNEGYVYKP